MADFEARKPIWIVLSELYLDTELQDTDFIRIAETFRESGLPIEVLKEIDLYEVFPTLQFNLYSVAGEWAGFDETWLVEACAKNYHKRQNKWFRFSVKIWNMLSYWMRKDYWDHLESIIKQTSK